jgi:hypothetical protein
MLRALSKEESDRFYRRTTAGKRIHDASQQRCKNMIAASTIVADESLLRCAEQHSAAEIEQAARKWIARNCPYKFYFSNVDFHFNAGVLTLHGRVHSFYLKQVLQTVLGELPMVERIDNFVEVISSVGLSSVRPK